MNEKSHVSQIRRIGRIFQQKLSHKHCRVSWRICWGHIHLSSWNSYLIFLTFTCKHCRSVRWNDRQFVLGEWIPMEQFFVVIKLHFCDLECWCVRPCFFQSARTRVFHCSVLCSQDYTEVSLPCPVWWFHQESLVFGLKFVQNVNTWGIGYWSNSMVTS